jgi:methylenetetrahydrofolate--tRNA-(uracil-5-)-methyltransferase
MPQQKQIKIIGGGLAGTETAWQLASGLARNKITDYQILLYEMRPHKQTPAHHTDNLAELVCSNSLGSEFLTTARGVLIHEMKIFDSLIIKSALRAKVPAGQALAVDRIVFAQEVTQAISSQPTIQIIRQEFTEADLNNLGDQDFLVIASGPLTSPSLAQGINNLLAQNQETKNIFLHFFDAAAPIVNEESIDMNIAFKASRYDKGLQEGSEGDYINCPFYSKDDFENFYHALISAERAPLKDFEKESMRYFEGCMPVEAIAERGIKTLTFGPLKPVGLRDPRYPEKKPYAVVQLRQDNVVGSLYNMVGFQTNLKWGEQKRVFSMIPGLENLEIVRYGVMHQNIFINSPLFLDANLNLRANPQVYFAGQITGVEGYTESAATGIVVARAILARLLAMKPAPLARETMLGALSHYVSHADPKNFQPINSNWGLLNPEPDKLDMSLRKNKKLRYEFFANKALRAMQSERVGCQLESSALVD